MKFGDLFSKSWGEYKENFGVFFKIFLVFSLIPTIIYSLAFLFFDLNIKNFTSILTGFVTYLPFIFLFIILYFIMSLSYLYLALFKQKNIPMNFGKAVKGGLNYFWKYIGLVLLIYLCLIPLFLLLVIPALIFAVYYMFSAYVLMRENTGIWESMKRSKLIVKGRWWGVFGYGLLIGIIIILISIPFSIPEFVFKFFTSLFITSGVDYSNTGITIISLLTGIIKSFATLITIPLSILFFKNFYLDLRTNLPKAK